MSKLEFTIHCPVCHKTKINRSLQFNYQGVDHYFCSFQSLMGIESLGFKDDDLYVTYLGRVDCGMGAGGHRGFQNARRYLEAPSGRRGEGINQRPPVSFLVGRD